MLTGSLTKELHLKMLIVLLVSLVVGARGMAEVEEFDVISGLEDLQGVDYSNELRPPSCVASDGTEGTCVPYYQCAEKERHRVEIRNADEELACPIYFHVCCESPAKIINPYYILNK